MEAELVMPTKEFSYSAPTSPARAAAFLEELRRGEAAPFVGMMEKGNNAEEEEVDEDDDFEFDFSGQLEMESLTADELFDGGRIKPLSKLLNVENKPLGSGPPKSPAKDAVEPDVPSAAAPEQTRRPESSKVSVEKRGRERRRNPCTTKGSSRSLSPFRVSNLLFDPEPNQKPTKNPSSSSLASFLSKKWRIKDLLLFRSASESRATDKEQMRKHSILRKARLENVRNSSIGSSSSRRISSHELHYTVNRAVSEEMRKRTLLPYKQGLLGCFGFHPSVHELSRTLSSSIASFPNKSSHSIPGSGEL